jgi:hypothetical protein
MYVNVTTEGFVGSFIQFHRKPDVYSLPNFLLTSVIEKNILLKKISTGHYVNLTERGLTRDYKKVTSTSSSTTLAINNQCQELCSLVI